MKRILTLIFLFTLLKLTAAVTAEISTVPEKPVAGEKFMIELTVKGDGTFSLGMPPAPDGLQISRRISGQLSESIAINGKQTDITTCFFDAVAG